MKVIAVNGSPRKKWNTATLLESALAGVASVGAETELIHLYDLTYKGCVSCFACKLIGGSSYGHCAMQDGLTPVLKKIEEADALLIGTPIYFGDITGELRSFLERLLFQYHLYDKSFTNLLAKKIPVGLIYTMNVGEGILDRAGYRQKIQGYEQMMGRMIGPAQSLIVTDTLQFDDYSKYETSAFNVDAKIVRRKEVFPSDCQKAYDMGASLAGKG